MATDKKQTPKQRAEMDAVLVRMLGTPPTPHMTPKPAKKAKVGPPRSPRSPR